MAIRSSPVSSIIAVALVSGLGHFIGAGYRIYDAPPQDRPNTAKFELPRAGILGAAAFGSYLSLDHILRRILHRKFRPHINLIAAFPALTVSAIAEGVLRKYLPRPSKAKPQPFSRIPEGLAPHAERVADRTAERMEANAPQGLRPAPGRFAFAAPQFPATLFFNNGTRGNPFLIQAAFS